MVLGVRVVALCLVVSLVAAGPFAPLSSAQQAAQPAPAAPPSGYQTQMAEEDSLAGQELPRPVYEFAAGVTTAFFSIPGRTITCVVGSAAAVGLLGLTLGTAYRAAGSILNEGCGGKWIVRADDLRPRPPVGERVSPEPR